MCSSKSSAHTGLCTIPRTNATEIATSIAVPKCFISVLLMLAGSNALASHGSQVFDDERACVHELARGMSVITKTRQNYPQLEHTAIRRDPRWPNECDPSKLLVERLSGEPLRRGANDLLPENYAMGTVKIWLG